MIAFQGDRMSSDHGRRAEFRGVPAPFVEAKNNHEHRGEGFLHVLGCMEPESTVSPADFRGVPAPFVEAKNSHEHRGEDFLHVLGCMEPESKVSRAEFRGVPALLVETENSHERQGAPSVEATVPESAGGRTQ